MSIINKHELRKHLKNAVAKTHDVLVDLIDKGTAHLAEEDRDFTPPQALEEARKLFGPLALAEAAGGPGSVLYVIKDRANGGKVTAISSVSFKAALKTAVEKAEK